MTSPVLPEIRLIPGSSTVKLDAPAAFRAIILTHDAPASRNLFKSGYSKKNWL